MSTKKSLKDQARVLLEPKNLLKSVASQFPVASIFTGMIDQIEESEAGERFDKIEAEMAAWIKSSHKHAINPQSSKSVHDWPHSVAEYVRRTVEITIVYDGVYHSEDQRGRELILSVGHGCLISDLEVIANKETLEMARDIATARNGRTIIQIGTGGWYSFQVEHDCEASALRVCKLTSRDEEKWKRLSTKWLENDLGDLEDGLIKKPVAYSITPWMGQEVGFLHTGEAENVLRGKISMFRLQFDTSVISHFRGLKEEDDTFLSFVTGVLPGRILHAGSPVFSREGLLMGIIADTESYTSDNGRRAVIRSLLGHPRFPTSQALS
jgi:hypothetical protein